MKHLLMLSTGGTISCHAGADGLAPQADGTQLLGAVRVPDGVRVEVRDLMCVDSTDVTDAQRLVMARALWENRKLYDGFVLTHGTDTMAYTAAFLCRVLPGFDKPVILTGSQLPMEDNGSDAPGNLADALVCAASGYRGIAVCFAGTLRRGTRVTKADTQAFDAFSGGNSDCPPDGMIEDGVLTLLDMPQPEEPAFRTPVPVRAAVLFVTPLLDAETVLACRGRDALLLYGYGVGGVPEAGGFYESIREGLAQGKTVVLTTQVQNEGSDLTVYLVGHRLKDSLGVLEAYDMTTEAALAKIMWILKLTKDPDEVGALFYTPVAHDILYRG